MSTVPRVTWVFDPTHAGTEQDVRSWHSNAGREVILPNEGSAVRWAAHGFPEPGVARWGYHPEYELHHIRSSEGRFIIGDRIGPFGPGQVTLIGPLLPHDWVSFTAPGEYVADRDVLLQFTEGWVERLVDSLPEAADLRARLDESRRGLQFQGATALRLAALMDQMGEARGIDRAVLLLQILQFVARAPAADVVSLEVLYARPSGANDLSVSAVDIAIDYVFKNLDRSVSLEEAARRARMSESNFSRRFKRASGLTFTDMVTQLRISHARTLLETTGTPVSVIASQVGYGNLSNFNRQFRRFVGVTPREHRRVTGRASVAS